MTANEVQLQLAELRSFDANVGEFAKAGIDAVDGAAFGDDLFYDRTRLPGAGARSGRKRDLFFGVGDGVNLREREFLAVEFEHSDKAEGKSKKEKVRARDKYSVFFSF